MIPKSLKNSQKEAYFFSWTLTLNPNWKNCADSSRPCRTAFDSETLSARSKTLTEETSKPDFWTSKNHEDILKELSQVNLRLENFKRIKNSFDDLETLEELLSESQDSDLESEFRDSAAKLRDEIERVRFLFLLNDEYDNANAILMIHAGSGGLDSQDWAGMLLRMYLRYCEREGFKANVIEVTADEGEGIKNATVMITGDYAYGLLKAERGVHRLVRISPFDSAHRRHTSFASVLVSPEFSDNVDIEIKPEDLKVDTFRASGAGGQYVNRTDSAVRITHLPTGIVVTCQNERSQIQNRATALHVLKSRLYDLVLQERKQELDSIVGDKKESSWGSQIRSYVLHPYTLVKDHRTNFEKGNIQSVLDGDINDFITEFLKKAVRN